MEKSYVIINMTELMDWYSESQNILPKNRRPSFVHFVKDDAERELLRLKQKTPSNYFTLFEAVAEAIEYISGHYRVEPIEEEK